MSDSEKNISTNKNMIDIILGNQNNKGPKDEVNNKLVTELQKENSILSKSIKDIRK